MCAKHVTREAQEVNTAKSGRLLRQTVNQGEDEVGFETEVANTCNTLMTRLVRT